MRFVVSLGDLDQDDLAAAGGKGANLGELIRAGFPVPDSFVVITDAYATVVQPLDLNIPERIAAGKAASVRRGYRDCPDARPLADRNRQCLRRVRNRAGRGPLQCHRRGPARSGLRWSARHLPHVVGEAAVIDAVQRCWGSLWTERAIAYRNQIKIDSADVRIAVVVQRMINAEVAGLMFTADPVEWRSRNDRGRRIERARRGRGLRPGHT